MIARLLTSRRFGALFVTQALGAINDNLFKNALVVLALFRLAHFGPVLVALSGGIFLLPYALFSTIAGQLADGHEKSRLIRLTKYGEAGLMLLAALGFLTGAIALLLLVLFGLGVQAAIFSPLKYGILPDLLEPDDLVAGNGLIEAGTFTGILLGTLAGSALILGPYGAALTAALCLLVAGGGLVSAYHIPLVPAAQPGLRLRWNLPREITALLADARANRPVWFAILGISWFWALGTCLLAEFPVLAHDRLHADAHVVSAMFGVFAIGIGIGSLAIARFGHRTSRFTHVALCGFAVSLFTADFAATALRAPPLTSLPGLLAAAPGWHLLADLLLLAIFGGAFSVPLYVLLQDRAAPSHRARMIGANNVVNALASVIAAGLTAGLYAAGLRAPVILLILAAANAAIAAWIWRYQGIFVPS